jgi:hypothetical protein
MDAIAVNPAASWAVVRGRTRRRKGDVDGRSTIARRFHHTAQGLIAELGGEATLSRAEMAMVRQCAAIIVRSEQMQLAVLRGEEVDHDELIRLSSESRRALLSLKRSGEHKRDPVLELRPISRGSP